MKTGHLNEYASVIEWSPQWSYGAPLPQVFSNGSQTFLLYSLEVDDPNWDGSYTTMVDNRSDDALPLAIITFEGSYSHRFGIVNDEAIGGHPLATRGLEVYRAHIVENSSWIEELKEMNKIHSRYSDKYWIKYKHFFFFFHDEIFEIIAQGFKSEIVNLSFKEAAIVIANKLNS